MRPAHQCLAAKNSGSLAFLFIRRLDITEDGRGSTLLNIMKSGRILLIFALAFASQLGNAQAFISGETIGNWIVNALKNFAMWIINGLKHVALSLVNAVRNWVTDLIRDVSHSLSSSTKVFKDNANTTITNMLSQGEDFKLPASMRFLIDIMEAGPLPLEWHYQRAELEKEMDHMKSWVSRTQWGLLGYITLCLMLIVSFCIIIHKNRKIVSELREHEVLQVDHVREEKSRGG